jgi:hypothetical protein
MVRHPKPPSQTWRTFLNNHVSQLASADFFTVHTVWFEVLFVLIVLTHDRRRVVHARSFRPRGRYFGPTLNAPVAFGLSLWNRSWSDINF